MKQWFDTWDGPITWSMHEVNIAVGGDIAYAHGLGHMTGKKVDGEQVDVWVRCTGGFRKKGGTWQVTHQHTSVPFYMDGSLKAAVDLKPE